MPAKHLPFLDWLKCIGMLLIVYGHAPAGTKLTHLDPIRIKQLGVALFVFVTAYCLEGERTDPLKAVIGRLSSVYIIGIGAAVAFSTVGILTIGDPGESNYLPFILGANVCLNFFPANPTTWYIGTYLHLMLIWALWLVRFEITPLRIVFWAGISVLLRALVMHWPGAFVAYMLFTNWLTVFLLGTWIARVKKSDSLSPWQISILLISFASVVFIWPMMTSHLNRLDTFPFVVLQPTTYRPANLLFSSLLVECLYSVATLSLFAVSLSLPGLRIVRFLARNTLVVFIAHMPLIYLLSPYLPRYPEHPWIRVAINVAVFYFGLAICSEVLLRVINIKRLRNDAVRLAKRFLKYPSFEI